MRRKSWLRPPAENTSGVSNPFLAGNEGAINPAIMNLPGHTSRTSRKLAATAFGPAGRFGTNRRPYEDQVNDYTIISGTPKTVLPKIRHVLEYLRPGSVFFWDGDGAMTHEDQMRSLRLMGEEVIPAVREMGKELELFSPFEVDPATGKPLTAEAGLLSQPRTALRPDSCLLVPSPSGRGFSHRVRGFVLSLDVSHPKPHKEE